MPTRTVDLTEHDDSFVESGIAAGHFSDINEAVRAGLHLLERQNAEDQAKLEWLRDTAQQAVASLDRGEGTPLSSAEDINGFVSEAIEEMRAARRATHA